MTSYSSVEQLRVTHLLTHPATREAIASLHLPADSHGLDVGCGIGEVTLQLAEAVGPGGQVVGLDNSTECLAVARRTVGSESRVQLVPGDLRHLPFGDAEFDWLWCSDTLWPAAVVHDPAEALREFGRVVKPGGMVALFYWHSQQLLAGHPLLEARLDNAFAAAMPYLSDPPPARQVMNARAWFDEATFDQVRGQSFTADIQGPLGAGDREAVSCWCHMLWEGLDSFISGDDAQTWRRLCDPGSADSLTASPTYFGFITYVLFCGRIKDGGPVLQAHREGEPL